MTFQTGKQYISDKINDDFKTWDSAKKIIISSPTGSGKTQFILRKLLPYAKEQNKCIIYFCNRIALRKQFEETLENYWLSIFNEPLAEENRGFLIIYTYQWIEVNGIQEEDKPRLCYVFDEAHYFMHDALFNSGTDFWRTVTNCRYKFPVLFLTATPNELYLYLHVLKNGSTTFYSLKNTLEEISRLEMQKNNLQHEINHRAEKLKGYNHKIPLLFSTYPDEIAQLKKEKSLIDILKPFRDFIEVVYKNKEREILEYSMPKNYNYLNPFCYRNYSQIVNMIIAEENFERKWLIFVRSKKQGYRLETEINAKLGNNKAVFIWSGSKNSSGTDGKILALLQY